MLSGPTPASGSPTVSSIRILDGSERANPMSGAIREQQLTHTLPQHMEPPQLPRRANLAPIAALAS